MSLLTTKTSLTDHQLGTRESLNPYDCITITPNRELSFKYIKNKFSCEVVLHNKGNETVLYRVRTTASKYYIVQPTCGVIPPKDKKTVQFFMPTKEHILKRADDKFLVQAFIYNGDDLRSEDARSVSEVFDLFSKTMSSKYFQNTKLRVHFDMNTPLRKECSQDWASTIRSRKFSEEDEVRSSSSRPRSSSQNHLNQWPKFNTSETSFQETDPVDLRELVNQKYAEIKQRKAQKQLTADRYGSVQTVDTNGFASAQKGSEFNKRGELEGADTRSSLLSSSNRNSKNRIEDEDSVYREVSDAKSSETSTNEMVQMYKMKFQALEQRFKKQKSLLAKVQDETVMYKTELNKLRITRNYGGNSEPKNNQAYGYSFETWKIMMVSVMFLIIGSLMK